MKINKQILYLGIFVSLIAILPWPIGFYSFTRILICSCSCYVAYFLYNYHQKLWVYGAALAVLYNPVLPVYLNSKPLWTIINIATAAFFFSLMTSTKKEND